MRTRKKSPSTKLPRIQKPGPSTKVLNLIKSQLKEQLLFSDYKEEPLWVRNSKSTKDFILVRRMSIAGVESFNLHVRVIGDSITASVSSLGILESNAVDLFATHGITEFTFIGFFNRLSTLIKTFYG